jgi:hypothetical protein
MNVKKDDFCSQLWTSKQYFSWQKQIFHFCQELVFIIMFKFMKLLKKHVRLVQNSVDNSKRIALPLQFISISNYKLEEKRNRSAKNFYIMF